MTRGGGASHIASRQLIQLSILTRLYLVVYSTIYVIMGLSVHIDQEVKIMDRITKCYLIYLWGLHIDQAV